MNSLGKRRVRLGAIAVVLVVSAVAAVEFGPGKQDDPVARADVVREVSRNESFNDPNRTIGVGMHLVNIHQFSMKDKLYTVEGWYWLRWPKTIQKTIVEDKIDPSTIVEFPNRVEGAQLDVQADSAEPLDVPD